MSATLYFTPTSCGAASVIAATVGGIFTDSLSGTTKSGIPVKALEADIRAHKVRNTFILLYWMRSACLIRLMLPDIEQCLHATWTLCIMP